MQPSDLSRALVAGVPSAPKLRNLGSQPPPPTDSPRNLRPLLLRPRNQAPVPPGIRDPQPLLPRTQDSRPPSPWSNRPRSRGPQNQSPGPSAFLPQDLGVPAPVPAPTQTGIPGPQPPSSARNPDAQPTFPRAPSAWVSAPLSRRSSALPGGAGRCRKREGGEGAQDSPVPFRALRCGYLLGPARGGATPRHREGAWL